MRLGLVWLAAACVVAAAVAGTIGGSLGADYAVGATTLPACNPTTQPLRPELGAVTINQGLDSYRNAKLVRGKETLVRFFLKLPSYVGQTCSGSVTVVNSTATPPATRLSLVNPGTGGALGDPIGPYIDPAKAGSTGFPIPSSSVQPNSDADPLFVVPASRVNACGAVGCLVTTAFSLQLKATVSYTSSQNSTPTSTEFSLLAGAPIIGNFSDLPNAFRVLVVPMGDASQLYSSQLSVAAQQAVQSGMDALSRMLPVPGGVTSTLRAASTDRSGIRYWIDLGAMLDLKSISGAYATDSTGALKFCGTLSNFNNAIKAKLAWYLQTYNSAPANAGFPADRVLGVVDKNISHGSTSSLNCAEGYASTNSPEAWVRAIPDVPADRRNPAIPSMTGSLMAMELLHTLGQENVNAIPPLIHSAATVADGTSPDRGYHLTNRSFIANDRTALNFVNTSTAPWNNNTTLLELGAFARAFCNLGGWVPPTGSPFQCTVPNLVGADPAPAGTGHFVLAATHDPETGTTEVTNSQLLRPDEEALDNHEILETPCLGTTGSSYHLAFYTFDANQPPTLCDIPTSGLVSEHDAETHTHSTTVTIAGAFSSPGGVTKVELRKGATLLHTEVVNPDGLDLVGASLNPGSGFTQTKTITTTVIPPKIDICLDQDESGSFGDDIETLRSLVDPETGTLIPALDDTGADYATCVTGFRDFAQGPAEGFPWGDAGDWVYKRHADVTAGGGGFEAGVDSLTAGGGGDLPEAQLENLHYLATPSHPAINSNGNFDPDTGEITTDPEDTPAGLQPTWRDRAKRVVLLATDAECHVTGDAGGWPGDDGTTSASTTAGILADAGITVIGLIPNVDSPIQCVSDLASGTDGSVHSIGSDSSELVNAMMEGLGNLDVTVQPSDDCDPGLSVTFDGNPAGEAARTVQSGEDVSWEEEFTVAEGAEGTLTCTIEFLVDEVVIDTQTVTVPVDNGPTAELKIKAPAGAKADTFIECNGGQLPGQVAVPGESLPNSISAFVINADTTNVCAGSNGSDPKISVSFTDGTSREIITLDGAGVTTETGAKPENPTASIYAPAVNQVNPANKPFALNGQVFDPDDGPLDPSWTITGPVGSNINGVGGNVISGVTGNFADVPPPVGGWPLGDYEVKISGTDADGNDAFTTVTVHVRSYVFSGFLSPIRTLPMINDGKVKSTIPIKWQLRDKLTGTLISDLGVVAAIRVASTPCPTTPNVCDVTPTGGTMLRYDTKNNQYVYNWLTPSQPGLYVVSVHFTDGSTYAAYFRLTK